MIGLVKAGRLLPLLAAATAIALAFHPHSARSAEPPKQGMDTVTIEAQRELRHQIDVFVSGAVVHYLNDSLERWDNPVCPAVGGLPKEQGEFILARISQIAKDVHAPLGAEHCKPNLVIVIATNVDELIAHWAKHEPNVLNTCNGVGSLNEFLHSQQPVRAYYNAKFHSSDNIDQDPAMFSVIGLSFDFNRTRCVAGATAIGTRLYYSMVQAMSSVIIVVDGKRTTDLNIGQLADYVAMLGLAQIRPDAELGTAPTILTLFRQTDSRPQELSPWDQSFLHSLYTVSQKSVLEETTIKDRMFQQIVQR
jgi:hypothetical protein